MGTPGRNNRRFVAGNARNQPQQTDLRARQFTSGPETPTTPTDSSPLRRLRSFLPDAEEGSFSGRNLRAYQRGGRMYLFASVSPRIAACKTLYEYPLEINRTHTRLPRRKLEKGREGTARGCSAGEAREIAKRPGIFTCGS